jgi:general secretion pathway protein J
MVEPNPGSAGFTLLELLVTLSLLGLLTMVMFGGLRFGVQVWARTGTDLTGVNNARKAEMLIEADLDKAYPLYSTTGTTAEIAFDGEAHRVRYLTPSNETPGSLDSVALEKIENGTTAGLDRTSRAELARSDEVHRKTLLTPLTSVTFSYFGSAHDGEKPTWSNEWRHRTRMPQRILIAIDEQGGRHEEMVVAPRLTADVGCVFDALTKSCRGR